MVDEPWNKNVIGKNPCLGVPSPVTWQCKCFDSMMKYDIFRWIWPRKCLEWIMNAKYVSFCKYYIPMRETGECSGSSRVTCLSGACRGGPSPCFPPVGFLLSTWSAKSAQLFIMSDHEEEHTIAEDLVVTKYKMAGEIVNRKCVREGAGCVVIRKFKLWASMFDVAHGNSWCWGINRRC